MDNSNLPAKLELRRHFLRAHHPAGRRRVFDAFQGGGVIWSTLGKELPLDSYWGVDLLEKPGRLKIDSCRILCQPGWTADVVDLDAYGSPWKHWLGVLENFARSPNHPEALTIFLTLGSRKGIQKRPLTKMEKQILGIPFWIPPMIGAQLGNHTLDFLLGRACDRFTVAESLETTPGQNARYFGLHLRLKA